MRRLLVVLALATACSTGPEAPLTTIVVNFTDVPTDADVAALEAVGGDLQHRIALARSVSMRANAGSSSRLPSE